MAEMIPFDGPKEEKDRPENSSTEQTAREPTREPNRAPAETRTYSNEEVSEIIRAALRETEAGQTDTVNHEEMLAIGRDFGLGPEDIARAFDRLHQTQAEEDQLTEARLWFKLHAVCFGVILVGLFALNWLTMPSFWWAFIPFFAWGCVVLVHGLALRYAPSFFSRILIQRTTARSAADSPGKLTGDRPRYAIVTFTIPELHGGLAEASGMVQMKDDYLLLEHQTRDAIFGAIKSDVKVFEIPYDEISSIRLERQFWTTKLILRSHRMKTFGGFPGEEGGKITLVVDKEIRAASEIFARDLAERIG